MNVLDQCERAREASLQIAAASTDVKNLVLYELAEDLRANKHKIITANKKDLQQNKNLSESMHKRLKVDEAKVNDMVDMVMSVAKLEDPVGKIVSKTELDKKLILEKVTV